MNIRLIAALLLGAGAAAGAAAPEALMGEWQAEQPASLPNLTGFRRVLFAPTAMILDGREAVAVRGYDLIDGAMRVRTEGGGDLLFVMAGDRLCLAEVDAVQPLPAPPQVRAGQRCFARRPA